MIPVALNPFPILFNVSLVLLAIGGVIGDAVLMVLMLRGRVRPIRAAALAAPLLFVFAALLFSMLWGGTYSRSFAVIFFTPVAAGLVVLFAVAVASPSRTTIVSSAIAVLVASANVVAWWDRDTRLSFGDAVFREDTAAVRALLLSWPVRHESVLERSAPLINAAAAANVEIITAIFEAGGADANVQVNGWRPLMDAIGSHYLMSSMYSRSSPDDQTRAEQTHPERQRRVIAYLLDHGADPNLPAGGITPAEEAWVADREDILALLKEKGARDVDTIPMQWNELLRAAAAGDVEQVRRLLASPVGKHQSDRQNRVPLVEAARNGHLDAVEVLIHAYGHNVKCNWVERASKIADTNSHVAISERLRKVYPSCFFQSAKSGVTAQPQ